MIQKVWAWSEFKWPEWVPEKLKEQIESFWSESHGRSPIEWQLDARANNAPLNGWKATAYFGRGTGAIGIKNGSPRQGRYLHAWNNMGRLVFPDGSWCVVSVHQGGYSGMETAELNRLLAERRQTMEPKAGAKEATVAGF